MPTLSSVSMFTGFDGTKLQISYAKLKNNADESTGTDGFLIGSGTLGAVYYNAGSTTAPAYTPCDFANYGYILMLSGVYRFAAADAFNTRPTTYTLLDASGSDMNLYWFPDGVASSYGGLYDIFRVAAVDNADTYYGNGNDSYSTGYVSARAYGLPFKASNLFMHGA